MEAKKKRKKARKPSPKKATPAEIRARKAAKKKAWLKSKPAAKKPPVKRRSSTVRGKWRDKSGRWRGPNGAYVKAPRIPRSQWPKRRDKAPDPKRVLAAKKGQKTKAFRQKRASAVGPLHGGKRADWYTLRALIETGDALWQGFLKKALELGKTDRQARDEWFSPKL